MPPQSTRAAARDPSCSVTQRSPRASAAYPPHRARSVLTPHTCTSPVQARSAEKLRKGRHVGAVARASRFAPATSRAVQLAPVLARICLWQAPAHPPRQTRPRPSAASAARGWAIGAGVHTSASAIGDAQHENVAARAVSSPSSPHIDVHEGEVAGTRKLVPPNSRKRHRLHSERAAKSPGGSHRRATSEPSSRRYPPAAPGVGGRPLSASPEPSYEPRRAQREAGAAQLQLTAAADLQQLQQPVAARLHEQPPPDLAQQPSAPRSIVRRHARAAGGAPPSSTSLDHRRRLSDAPTKSSSPLAATAPPAASAQPPARAEHVRHEPETAPNDTAPELTGNPQPSSPTVTVKAAQTRCTVSHCHTARGRCNAVAAGPAATAQAPEAGTGRRCRPSSGRRRQTRLGRGSGSRRADSAPAG